MCKVSPPLLSSQWAMHSRFDITPNVSRVMIFSFSHWTSKISKVCADNETIMRWISPCTINLSLNYANTFSLFKNNKFISNSSQASVLAYNRDRLLRITPMIWFGGLYQFPQSADYEESRSLWILLFVMAFDFSQSIPILRVIASTTTIRKSGSLLWTHLFKVFQR